MPLITAGETDTGGKPVPDRAVRSRREVVIALVLLAGVTLAVFWRVLANDFIYYDDTNYIKDNLYVRTGLHWGNIAWAFTSVWCSNWHPLTWISHMVDCQLYGLNPVGHHLTSLLLHIASTLILFLVLKRMTGYVWRSAFVAALFAVHPLHVESVAWAAERKDVLSTLFWMLTMLAYVSYVQSPSRRRYGFVLLLFALGLLSKPMLVTLPFVLLLMDYWPLKRLNRQGSETAGTRSLGALVLEKVPLFVLSAASSIMTMIAQKEGGAVSTLAEYPLGTRAANAVVACVSYIGKMLWPHRLAVLYPHPGTSIPTWQVGTSVVLLIALTALLLGGSRKHPYAAVGWLWYLGTLVPVIGLVQVGMQAMADRYTYIPFIGLFLIIAWGVPDLAASAAGSRMSKALVLPAFVIIAVLSFLTYVQLGYWRNSRTLFEHALAVTTPNELALTNVGLALVEEGRVDDGIKEYVKALRIAPGYVDARMYLGMALVEKGEKAKAVRQFTIAVRLDPNNARAHLNLGVALASQWKIGEAAKHFREAVRLRPDYGYAHYNLAVALYMKRRYDEAWRETRLSQKYGYVPAKGFLGALSRKSPSHAPSEQDQE